MLPLRWAEAAWQRDKLFLPENHYQVLAASKQQFGIDYLLFIYIFYLYIFYI